MTTYYYLKGKPKKRSRKLRLVSLFFLSFGLGVLSWLTWPFLEWRVVYIPRFTEAEILRPIPSWGKEITSEEKNDSLLSARNWFPQVSPPPVSDFWDGYTLSIPKLKISQAQVLVGTDDLSKSLIQWGGATLPGQRGTVIVFGHSILPQFFNPQDYKSIFSTLHTLEKGDEILIGLDGIEYKYQIFGMEIIDPSNISFLEQKTDDAYLYLITCTPPGTYWKRLIVKAKLEEL